MKKNYMMPPLDLLTESPARKTTDMSVIEDEPTIFPYDDSLADKIKVILIASSK